MTKREAKSALKKLIKYFDTEAEKPRTPTRNEYHWRQNLDDIETLTHMLYMMEKK